MAKQLRTERTRQDILQKAIDLASVEGLEGLTIGRLADSIFMSKSGLFAHFGSKEELQLAVVDTARELFVREVFAGAMERSAGLARLLHMASAWLAYVERGVFRGGCFFASVSSEVDDRPGRVRDRVVDLTRSWIDALESEVEQAAASGEFHPDTDPSQVAFEIHAFVQEANWAFQLHGDAGAFGRAGRAIDRTLRTHVTESGLEILDPEDAKAGVRRGSPRGDSHP